MTTSDERAVVRVESLRFGFDPRRVVLHIDRFAIQRGERVFLRGPSGSGKSTLLSLLSGVLVPDAGSITLLGQTLSSARGARRDALRAAHIGIVFQMFNLLPFLDVLRNVTLPCRFSPLRAQRAVAAAGTIEDDARRLLEHLGLGDPALLRASARQLSVGQQQRVAAARALTGAPELILADEPTSALDADARARFIELLLAETAASGASLLFASHDASLASHFDRSVDLPAVNQ